MLILFTVLAFLFNCGDYWTTIIALRRGAKEANPIGRFLFRRPPWAFIIKMILINIVIITNSTLFPAILWATVFGFCCINNSIVLLLQWNLLKQVPKYTRDKYELYVDIKSKQVYVMGEKK